MAAKSLRAAASLITASRPEKESFTAIETYTKNAVIKLKNSNLVEKNELKKLNAELHTYLNNVRALEALNKQLIAEVDRAKAIAFPMLVNKTYLDSDIEKVRLRLEDDSNQSVRYQIRIDESEMLIQELNERIRFFEIESETQKQKISDLVAQLSSIQGQRENLLRSALTIEDDVTREQAKHRQSEKDLEHLRISLRENRLKNKGLEFEIQTLLDELAFRKAVFTEEANELRNRPGTILNPVDLTNFYKSELEIAIRQIRQDFSQLSEQQLKDYKELKENEMSLTVQAIEYERSVAQQQKAKMEASMDLDMQTTTELKSILTSTKTESSTLTARHSELVKKLGYLENGLLELKLKNKEKLEKLQAEIELLRQSNSSYESDIEYWNRITRTKLESEIQTYRSILNCQIKLMQNSTLSYELLTKNTSTITTTTNVTTTKRVDPNAEYIDILRQVFNYFDSDRSGTVSVLELDKILAKLNVKLSREAYNKLMRDADRDGSRDINFEEFCRLMLPVFTGDFSDDDLWYAFKKFDRDNTGYITVSELKDILSKIGQNFTEREIEAMIRTVDSNFDGKLSFKEFSRLMRSPALS